MQKLILWGILIFSGLAISACYHQSEDDYDSDGVLRFETVILSSKNEVPSIEGRITNGTAKIVIDNNLLLFNIDVDNVSGSDSLTASHIHLGGPGENGGVLVTLVDGDKISFKDGEASGVHKLEDDLIEKIKDESVQLYINVHSTNHPAGLVRGTLR